MKRSGGLIDKLFDNVVSKLNLKVKEETTSADIAFIPGGFKSDIGKKLTKKPKKKYEAVPDSALEESSDKVWWHGSPNGKPKDTGYGIHLGTFKAAEQALNARIGVPVEGYWDGTRKYGETLLAGKNKLGKYQCTGYNCDAPEDDYYPDGSAAYSDGTKISLDSYPAILPYKLIGKMSNNRLSAYDDFKANGYIKAAFKRGIPKTGFYYKNVAEDAGSISIVVPFVSWLEEIDAASPIEEAITFDLTTTDMPFYDGLLKNPEYYNKNKEMTGFVVEMHPVEYIDLCAQGFWKTEPSARKQFNHISLFKADMMKMRDNGMVYRKWENAKLPMPVLEFGPNYFTQEGLHRALAADKQGIKSIPVVIAIKNEFVNKASTVYPILKKYISDETLLSEKQLTEAVDNELQSLKKKLSRLIVKKFTSPNIYLLNRNAILFYKLFGGESSTARNTLISTKTRSADLRNLRYNIFKQYNDIGNIELLISALEDNVNLSSFDIFKDYSNLYGVTIKSNYLNEYLYYEAYVDMNMVLREKVFIRNQKIIDALQDFKSFHTRSNMLFPIRDSFNKSDFLIIRNTIKGLDDE